MLMAHPSRHFRFDFDTRRFRPRSLNSTRVGIAESNDFGNFDKDDSGLVLLDLLSKPSGSGSLNSVTLTPGASKIDLVATALGNIASHEAGHLFGLRDTVPGFFAADLRAAFPIRLSIPSPVA
jgi:hypothetical protein